MKREYIIKLLKDFKILFYFTYLIKVYIFDIIIYLKFRMEGRNIKEISNFI